MEGQEGKTPIINPEHPIGQQINKSKDAILKAYTHGKAQCVAGVLGSAASYGILGFTWQGVLAGAISGVAGGYAASREARRAGAYDDTSEESQT
jgi:hypothetical protein